MLSGICTHFRIKKLKRITEYDGLGGIFLKFMFWKYICTSLLTEMDPLMTMNMNT